MGKNQKFARTLLQILLLIAEVILFLRGTALLQDGAALANFTEDACETDGFRSMQIDADAYTAVCDLAAENELSPYTLLASLSYDNAFVRLQKGMLTDDCAQALSSCAEKQEKKPEALAALADAYAAVWADAQVFPVPESTANAAATVSFEDSWQEARTYGGKRTHEGTDIMADINERGLYPVVSMTDGVVEKIGWLSQGGYRIGVRAPHGGYFYYAHLASYARDFAVGEEVKAGDLLGLMGDTGYSETEGTTGNFPVHLHIGIYIATENASELSVDPYAVLKILEAYKVSRAF